MAERLVRVQRGLRRNGVGLIVWDCYRPFSVQQRLWALVPDARFVAEPVVEHGKRAPGSKHNRAVAEGFEPLATEWWHFDAPGWQRYDLLDEPLAR